MWLLKQIKSKNESNPAFKFLLTGGTALGVLFLIFVVFLCWYKRYRKVLAVTSNITIEFHLCFQLFYLNPFVKNAFNLIAGLVRNVL